MQRLPTGISSTTEPRMCNGVGKGGKGMVCVQLYN